MTHWKENNNNIILTIGFFWCFIHVDHNVWCPVIKYEISTGGGGAVLILYVLTTDHFVKDCNIYGFQFSYMRS